MDMFYCLVGAGLCVLAGACASQLAAPDADARSAELSQQSQEILARFEPTDETLTCVSTRRIRDIKPLSDQLFLVRVGQNNYYLNRSNGTCVNATKNSNALTYNVSGAPNLCVGETVNVISNRSPTFGLVVGGCALGNFVKLEQKPRL